MIEGMEAGSVIEEVKRKLQYHEDAKKMLRGPHFNMIIQLAQLEKEMVNALANEPIFEQCAHEPKVSTDQVLRFAYRIRPALTAPKEWHPPMPMLGFLPPAPVPENMWTGALASHGQDLRIRIPPPIATRRNPSSL